MFAEAGSDWRVAKDNVEPALAKPSGSLVVLAAKVMLPLTRSRNDARKQVRTPITVRLPPIVLSSKSVYWGVPFGPWLKAGSSDQGAGLGAAKHPPDFGGPPRTPPPPPRTVAFPPTTTVAGRTGLATGSPREAAPSSKAPGATVRFPLTSTVPAGA